ncbi:uncharacterized protein L969DRAFT_60291 [Mixia osmundae IAM 14324]|uniref:Uncharacterized protein n=1 Tax=Mixia osmundae (strain CBS 9802 / IAM 14324 / JCM 22182 / KY 12970) TaxID=764103 RepID=G7DUD7_MIXOS|nr:uncharacterized protein L969DRAFT_60291 [Mixia osmundae IAM 14324]KEI41069.1 hypothetical protein L969DRAFT_60291 [Mixia osmundae IAM 14324]GAA94197.1 hypothetical protein E5Q_00845 [Mixia osmundae IAM 14324]
METQESEPGEPANAAQGSTAAEQIPGESIVDEAETTPRASLETTSVAAKSMGVADDATDAHDNDDAGDQDSASIDLFMARDPISLYGEVSLPRAGILGVPGVTHETAALSAGLLTTNHAEFHCFFNDKGFHNHLAHAILTVYSLGATSEQIKATYERCKAVQRPMLPLKDVVITEENWRDFLGREAYYSRYLQFFITQCRELGGPACIERYVLEDDQGQMLIRWFSGAWHPFILTGFGIEFALDAVTAEGLAACCVHSPQAAPLLKAMSTRASKSPFLTFASSFATGLRPLAARASPSVVSFVATAQRLPRIHRVPKEGLSGLTIIDHMSEDPRLRAGQANSYESKNKFDDCLHNRAKALNAWCAEWIIDSDGGWEEIVMRAEELIWIATLLESAVSRPGQPTRCDFFLMHGLNSMLFLPSMLEVLSPSSRITVLECSFRMLVAYWVARGRPQLHIVDVLMRASNTPKPPSEAIADQSAGTVWPSLIAAAATHPDEHLSKAIRSLAFAASLFGHSPPGIYKCSLPGSDILDGSCFVRAAGLHLNAIGWCLNDEEPADWDRSGLGFDEAWQAS